MSQDNGGYPVRDERLAALLAEAAPVRERSEPEWTSLQARIVDRARLELARRRRTGWHVALTGLGPRLALAASITALVLGGMVYATPRPGAAFLQASAELIDLLGEEEVRSFFPGVNDPDRLLEAAIAAQ
jgi:hypothetical protein